MRILMWFTIGFAAACAAGVYLVSGSWLLWLALFCLCAAVGMFIFGTKWSKITALVVAGCMFGFLWQWGFDSLYLQNARAYDGKIIHAEFTVIDYSVTTQNGITADGRIALEGKTYPIRAYLDDIQDLKPGDLVSGSFQLRYTGTGGKQEVTYHSGKGIFLLGYAQQTPEVTPCEKVPARYFAPYLRKQITGLLDRIFPADTVGFARALLLGDTTRLSDALASAFRSSGIYHIIAVSGLHVSILFSLIYFFSGKRRVLTALIGIPVLAMFAAIAGFTPSVVRACLMQTLMIIAMLLNKEYVPLTALSFAVLVLLAVNPISISSVSLQLSVGCMIGIFAFSGRIHDYLLSEKRFGPAKGKTLKARLIRWVVGSISVSTGAMIVTTPLCAIYFRMVSLIGIVTNLAVLWLVNFIFYAIMAAGIFGSLFVQVGVGIAWVVSWPMRLVQTIATVFAKAPLATVSTESPFIVMWLITCYILLAVFLLAKKKSPLLLCGCMGVCLAVAVTASSVSLKHYDTQVAVLDVGQGQCIYLQTDGCNYLVDCGGNSAKSAADTAVAYLRSQGIRSLDGLILTHFDEDHSGGAPLLMNEIFVETLYLPQIQDENPVDVLLEETYGDRICRLMPQEVVELETGILTLFAGNTHTATNENSICVLFQPENYDILITGDREAAGERALLAATELPELEVLVVGHHGASDAACLELLHRTTPAAAVISVGRNSYGHPSAQALERLRLFGCAILRTDQEGTIVFKG